MIAGSLSQIPTKAARDHETSPFGLDHEGPPPRRGPPAGAASLHKSRTHGTSLRLALAGSTLDCTAAESDDQVKRGRLELVPFLGDLAAVVCSPERGHDQAARR